MLFRSNKGSDLDVVKMREFISAGKNALALTNNKLNNYEIRAEEYENTALFADIMNEIVMAGKQAYDDVTVMIRSFRRGFAAPIKVGQMTQYMTELDDKVRYLSKYMYDITKITSNLSGLLVGLRINDGNITPGARDAIKGRYQARKSELDVLQKDAEITKDRVYNIFNKS